MQWHWALAAHVPLRVKLETKTSSTHAPWPGDEDTFCKNSPWSTDTNEIWKNSAEKLVALAQWALPDHAGQPDAKREAAHLLPGGPVRPGCGRRPGRSALGSCLAR